MTPHDSLQHSKAAFDREIDGLLLALNENEMAFRQRILQTHTAAGIYQKALTTTAAHVSQEVGEAYQETAKETVRSTGHLIRLLLEHRLRRGNPGGAGASTDTA